MKIVVEEKMSSSAVNLLREPGWNVVTADQLNGSLAQELETADALLVRSAGQGGAAPLADGGQLRVIGRAGVGVGNIRLEPATPQRNAVQNTPGAHAVWRREPTPRLT